MPKWTIERTDSHAHRISFDLTNKTEKPFRVLLAPDVHWDSKQCDLKLFKSHLDEAKAEDAAVMLPGDFFDAMQGKWDRRASFDSFREEHRYGNYLDRLVDTAADWLKPYAPQIAIISYGNHETSILKHHQVDLAQRLASKLREYGSNVEVGNYWGFVSFSGKLHGGTTGQATLHYHHGYGGGGEVTRGNIDHSRTRSQYWADIFISGHIHRRNEDENIMGTLSSQGKVTFRRQLFLRASTYKREIDGYHSEKGRGPRPVGGWWVEFFKIRKPKTRQYELQWDSQKTSGF
jgi:hypothetical protein